MPWYRMGEPGEDTSVHLNMGRRAGPAQCVSPAFEKDNHELGNRCGRMSVALCDHPGCDAPMCEGHRTKHVSKANTDFCSLHKEDANA